MHDRFLLMASCAGALALAIGFVGCNQPKGVSPGSSTITLKGTVTETAAGTNGWPLPAPFPAGSGTARKVLAFSDIGNAQLSEIGDDGKFSINVARSPCGLVFLDESDAVVGYLSLATGINALPLSMVDDSIGEIDFESITITDGVGLPTHNPLETGGETEMDETELAVYRLQSSLFSVIINNLDMNDDGTIDVLSDRLYYLMFDTSFVGGVASAADPGESAPLPVQEGIRFNFSDFHAAESATTNVLITPDATEITYCAAVDLMYSFYPQDGPSPFTAGEYTIVYASDQKQIGFDLTSPLTADNHIVASPLWYEMQGTTVHKVHWRWKTLSGAAVDASRLLKPFYDGCSFGNCGVFIDFFSEGTTTPPPGCERLDPSVTECVVDIDADSFSQVQGIGVTYTDLFGNHMFTGYELP